MRSALARSRTVSRGGPLGGQHGKDLTPPKKTQHLHRITPRMALDPLGCCMGLGLTPPLVLLFIARGTPQHMYAHCPGKRTHSSLRLSQLTGMAATTSSTPVSQQHQRRAWSRIYCQDAHPPCTKQTMVWSEAVPGNNASLMQKTMRIHVLKLTKARSRCMFCEKAIRNSACID